MRDNIHQISYNTSVTGCSLKLDSFRVALMVWDYHDVCKGKHSLCGSAALSSELLKKSGYQVLNISYKDYNFRDKLTDRVSYIERQLRSIVVKE